MKIVLIAILALVAFQVSAEESYTYEELDNTLWTYEGWRIDSVWCNPRMDDECYINEQVKVPYAKLIDYLPLLTQDYIDARNLDCERPVCTNVDHAVKGLYPDYAD